MTSLLFKKRSLLTTALCLSLTGGVGSVNAENNEVSILNTLPNYTTDTSDFPISTLTLPLFRVEGERTVQGTIGLDWDTGQFEVFDVKRVPMATKTEKDDGFDPVIAEQLDQYLDKVINEYGKPGAVIRVDMGEHSWRGVAGISRFQECCGDKPRIFSEKFRIGSITKMIVASAVMALVQDGKLDLDDTMEELFSGESWYSKMPNGDKITVRDVLRHQTGLADHIPQASFLCHPFTRISPIDLLIPAFEKSQDPNSIFHKDGNQTPRSEFEIGTDYEYSNTNYVIAGLLIEKATGKSVVDGINRYVLIPLKAFNTAFPVEVAIPYVYASGYMKMAGSLNEKGECIINPNTADFQDTTFIEPSLPWTAGGMISNVNDLVKIVKGQATGTSPELSSQLLEQRFDFVSAGHGASYGLGIYDIEGYLGHLGQIVGFDNAVFYHPEKDIAIAINMNAYPLGQIDASKVFDEVREILDEKTPRSSAKQSEGQGFILNPACSDQPVCY